MAEDDGLTEFPVGSREICDFERNLTSIYCTSATARERRPKNIVHSITWCKEKSGLEHEYLVVQIKNHNDDNSTSLKLERTRNPTNSSTSLMTAHLTEENSHAETHKRPSLSLRVNNSSTASLRESKSCLGAHVARDLIQMFEGHPRSSDQTYREIQFQNNDFTLYSLTIIAKVVHDVRERYHIQESQCYWFAATVLGAATVIYEGTTADSSPSGPKLGTIRGLKILDVFWGADVKMEVERVREHFERVMAEKEQTISLAANPEVAIVQAKAKAQEVEQQAKSMSELAEREAEKAKKQVERALHEAEEAKREAKKKDAEIERLQRLLAGLNSPNTFNTEPDSLLGRVI